MTGFTGESVEQAKKLLIDSLDGSEKYISRKKDKVERDSKSKIMEPPVTDTSYQTTINVNNKKGEYILDSGSMGMSFNNSTTNSPMSLAEGDRVAYSVYTL